MEKEDREFLNQAVLAAVQPLYVKIDGMKETQETHQKYIDEKFHELFKLHNAMVAPRIIQSEIDIAWLRRILAGCWAVVLFLLEEIVRRLWITGGPK